MRSPDEVRAEIERIRFGYLAALQRGHGDIVTPLPRIAALEWVLADEQDKPKETDRDD